VKGTYAVRIDNLLSMCEEDCKLKIANCQLQIEIGGLQVDSRRMRPICTLAFCRCQFAVPIAAKRPLLPGAVPEEA
jgi:hypothetical protein